MLTVILTGGKSRRMGRDKALLPWHGETMLSSLIERYGNTLGEVAVSVDKAGRFECGHAFELVDVFPGMGPINGILSAFSQTASDTIFLTATDLPNGDPLLAKYLAERKGGSDACIIQRTNGNIEPLFAVYGRNCLQKAEEFLKTDRKALYSLLKELDVVYVPDSELGAWDLDKILINVNTPEDYEKLKKENGTAEG
jgi:molybdopterin-guanine dinucleotide biosynthesis protein A